MSTDLADAFGLLGARVRVSLWEVDEDVRPAELIDTLRVDVRRDESGEYFDLRCDPAVELEVADVQPDDRHLLLTARVPSGAAPARGEADPGEQHSVFLCGRDERSWFVAAIPEAAGARDVQGAKDALKPQAVWDAMREFRVPLIRRDARKTAAFVRQGEWFFIPRPRMKVDRCHVLRDEPISRGAGKPHLCQFLHRRGGELVYFSFKYPNGLTPAEYRALPGKERNEIRWERRVREAHVFVKGNIRHPDHKTVFLSEWHEVVQNTETQARAISQVAFLD
jgi:hypothetical protein